MDSAFPDAVIEFEFAEAAILEPVDVNDRHVVDAAMAVQANAIVTPDDFVMDLVKHPCG